MNGNLHAFTNKISASKAGYLAGYSCVFSLQNAIFRCYTSVALTYEELKIFDHHYRNKDMAGFSESYIVPLIQTNNLELIIDGCQYWRVDKIKNIADWDIAQKYLNVCLERTADASNCGVCSKCLRTLLPLEILGKLDNYSAIFDIPKYREVSLDYKIHCLKNYGKAPFETENVDFAREHNFPMPTLKKK